MLPRNTVVGGASYVKLSALNVLSEQVNSQLKLTFWPSADFTEEMRDNVRMCFIKKNEQANDEQL